MDHLASRRKWWYLISLCLILPGVISLISLRTQAGNRLHGRHALELQFDHAITTQEIRSVLEQNGYGGSSVQISSEGGTDNVALIRMRELQERLRKRRNSPRTLPLKSARIPNSTFPP